MPEAKADRISELPEDLLVMILSLLPTRDAVATMFLSKRWHFVWTMVRTLEYKDKGDEEDESNKKSVWWFLNKSLEIHKAHVIDYLDIELGPQCPTDADIPKLVDKVSISHVIDLSFKLLWSRDPINLPMSLYTCKTIYKLTLSNKVLVDFPSSLSACCLPSLVILRMFFVVYKDEASLVSFLSSCPKLKLLAVRRKNDDNVRKFSVKLHSLWSLYYSMYLPDEESDVVEDNGRCLVIDTPSLKELHIHDDSGDSCSVENMPHLENASIYLGSSFPGSHKFIRSISSVVSSLELIFTNEVVKHCSTMKLPQLKKLIIYPYESDWFKPLMLLLQNARILKFLTINYDVYDDELENLSWNQPSFVPACLSSQLEIFNWIEYEDSIEADEFLTYLFNNSKCLKTAKISVRPTTLEFLDDEDLIEIEKELNDIPRASSTSNLFVEMRKNV